MCNPSLLNSKNLIVCLTCLEFLRNLGVENAIYSYIQLKWNFSINFPLLLIVVYTNSFRYYFTVPKKVFKRKSFRGLNTFWYGYCDIPSFILNNNTILTIHMYEFVHCINNILCTEMRKQDFFSISCKFVLTRRSRGWKYSVRVKRNFVNVLPRDNVKWITKN